MIAWQPGRETFCTYVYKRWRRRRAMLDDLHKHAANDTSRRLVDRLAKDWRIDRHLPGPAPAADLAELAAWRERMAAARP